MIVNNIDDAVVAKVKKLDALVCELCDFGPIRFVELEIDEDGESLADVMFSCATLLMKLSLLVQNEEDAE